MGRELKKKNPQKPTNAQASNWRIKQKSLVWRTVVGTLKKFSMWCNPGLKWPLCACLKSLLHREWTDDCQRGLAERGEGSMDMDDGVGMTVEKSVEGINDDGNNNIKKINLKINKLI